MTKLISILFSLLILYQSFNINLEDYSKISILLEHASFHKENYGHSFLEFLAEHYGENFDSHNNDHEEHKDLPFKHDQQTCHHLNFNFTLNPYSFQIKKDLFSDISLNFFYSDSFSLFEKPSVFQPPKFA